MTTETPNTPASTTATRGAQAPEVFPAGFRSLSGGLGALRIKSTQHLFFAIIALITLWRIIQLVNAPHTLFFDEAQYWSWALDPDFGYFSKPPMVAWVIGLTTSVFGHEEWAVRLGSPLIHSGTALIVWAIARRLFDKETAFWSGLSYVMLPGVAFSAGIVSTDVQLLFFWAGAIYCFVRLLDTDASPKWWIALGVMLGLGLLSKYTMVLFIGCAGLYILLHKERWHWLRSPWLYATLALAFLIYLPNLLWNASNDFISFQHTAANANLGGPLINPNKFAEFFGSQFGVFGPFMMIGLIWMLVRWRTTFANPNLRLLLLLSLPVLAMMLGQSLLSRAHPNWAAVTYVGASIGVVAWARLNGRMILIYASLILHLVASTFMYNYDAILSLTGTQVSSKLDPFKRVRGWDILGEKIIEHLNAHPGYGLITDSRKSIAEMKYYGGQVGREAIKWNPRQKVGDHYDLVTTLNGKEGESFLFLTHGHIEAGLLPYFEKVTLLEDIVVPTAPDYALRFSLYRVDAFQGYDRSPY